MTQAQPSNQLVQQTQRKDISSLLQSPQMKNAIAAALPKHLTPERFIRTAITATMRTPKLLQCSQESLFQCLLDLSAYGLEPDGRRAHLIPYGTVCTLIIDYKGIAELVRRSGDVSYIHADAVYPGDEWSYAFGSNAHLNHKPNFNRPETDKPFCFYSFVKLKDGSEDFVVMSTQQVDRIRKRSKAQSNGPWVTDYDEMGKKTAFRNHSKWLPLSSDVRNAIEHGEESDAIDITASMNAAESIQGSVEAQQRVLAEKLAAIDAEKVANGETVSAQEEKPQGQDEQQQQQSTSQGGFTFGRKS